MRWLAHALSTHHICIFQSGGTISRTLTALVCCLWIDQHSTKSPDLYSREVCHSACHVLENRALNTVRLLLKRNGLSGWW